MEVRNRIKGLDLIDRVPGELWTEVRDTVQETGIKTIPMEKKLKKAKWLSEEALQIAVKRREASQLERVNSSALSLLYGPNLTFVHDFWKNYCFDYMNLCQQNVVSASEIPQF